MIDNNQEVYNLMNEGVKVWEDKIIKFTYKVLEEDPLPHFFSKHYPYTKIDMFNSKPIPVEYKAIFMENEYLKLTVFPELGARLYSVYDKVSEKQVFHYNDTIRPTMIAHRGAWIAVGIEFNLCQVYHHTVDNFSPVDYLYRKDENGSATVYISSLNKSSNVRYLIALTLRSGDSRIGVEIKTFNTELIPNRYYFWSNAAIDASKGLRFFYPGFESSFGPYPINKRGIDLSWYKNHKWAGDIFIIDSEENFFACYNYDDHRGVIHYADHHMIPGKKIFTWGTSKDGLFWKDLLSDKSIPYIEIQSGRFLTMKMIEFIDPLAFDRWKEYWYPVREIGGITYANEAAALYIKMAKMDNNYLAKIKIQPAIKLNNGILTIHCNNKEVYKETINLKPEASFVKELIVPSDKIIVKINDRNGRELILWDYRKYRAKSSHESVWNDCAEELWLKGIDAEKKRTRFIAKTYYERALKKDSGFSRALCSLALLDYHSGLYEDAIMKLEKAIKRDPHFEDANYYLGLAYLAIDNLEDSERELWKIYSGHHYGALAAFLLGIIKLRRRRYGEAEEFFRNSLAKYSLNLKAICMLSASHREQRKIRQALEVIEKGYKLMPLDYLVLTEKHLLMTSDDYKKIVLSDVQKVLEVAKDYIFAGLYNDSLRILSEAVVRKNCKDNPLIYYYIGYVQKKLGANKETLKYYRIGSSKVFNYIFPHRLEEINILEDVTKKLPLDPVPRYLLGNLLFYRGRVEDGLKLWEEAAKLKLEHSVLYRNLGLAYTLLNIDLSKAARMYLKAIRLNPRNHRLYIELDDVYGKMGCIDKRVNLFERVSKKIKRDSFLARLASAYVDAGKYDEALNILVNTSFTPREGYYGFWEIYVDTLLGKGLKYLKKGINSEALKCFMGATKYPKNLGVGMPFYERRRDVIQLYYAGIAHLRMGNEGKAYKVWQQAIRRESSLIDENSFFKALILKKLKMAKDSEKLLMEMLSSISNRIKQIYEDFEGEPKYLVTLHKLDQRVAYLYYVKGLSLIGLGNIDEGSSEIKKSLSISKSIRHARWVKEKTFVDIRLL